MCLVNAGQYVATLDRTSRELDKKGSKRIVKVLFVGVPKVEIEVRQGGQAGLPQRQDILDNPGAN